MKHFLNQCAFAALFLASISVLTAEAGEIPSARLAGWHPQVAFEPNRGQAAGVFDYTAHGFGYALNTSPSGIQLVLTGGGTHAHVMGIDFLNATADAKASASDSLGYTISYVLGRRRIPNVPAFGNVRYSGVWPGIDVAYYGTEGKLEYDFVAAPHADLRSIRLRFSGMSNLEKSAAGDLVLSGTYDRVIQQRPVAYQREGSTRRAIAAEYKLLADGSVAIALGPYDHDRELVIDPILVYQTTSLALALPVSSAAAAAMDASGVTYIAGTTAVSQSSPHATAFVTRIDNSGRILQEFDIGAPDGDLVASGVAVNSAGQVFFTGFTTSTTGLPLGSTGSFQNHAGGLTDAFLAKTDMTNLLYSTYLGGSGNDLASNVAADGSVAYVVGQTTSVNFPIPSPPAQQNGFIVALNTTVNGPSGLVYQFPLGGSGIDAATSVAVDGSANAYIGGSTTSTDFSPNSTTGYSTTKSTSNNDGFLLKLNASGTPVWFTYFPGGVINGVAQFNSRFAYVTGQTTGSIAVTGSAFESAGQNGNPNHAFFADLDTSGSGSGALVYSTYFGGTGQDVGLGIAADRSGRADFGGYTSSSNLTTVAYPNGTAPAQATYAGGNLNRDGFFAIIDPAQSGSAGLVYSTYVGSSGNAAVTGVATDQYNDAAMSATSYDSGGNPNGGFAVQIGSPIWAAPNFVTQLYNDILDRPPDTQGLNSWTQSLTSGQVSRPQLANLFFQSPEFANGGLNIIKYYIAVLGRDPDFGGWQSWFTQYIQGLPLSTILAAFINSPEFQNTYGSLSNSAFVTLVYQNVLGRAPDQNGFNTWLGQLNSGQITRAALMGLFIASPEFNNDVRARAYANLLYLGFLRRTPDPSGLQYWTNALADPNALPSVITSFIMSPEYVARFQ